jgi:hypothetical protein
MKISKYLYVYFLFALALFLNIMINNKMTNYIFMLIPIIFFSIIGYDFYKRRLVYKKPVIKSFVADIFFFLTLALVFNYLSIINKVFLIIFIICHVVKVFYVENKAPSHGYKKQI